MASSGGLIGQDIDQAQRHDFFRWFHLGVAGGEQDGGGRTRVDFRPTGNSFHGLVVVSTWLGANEQVQCLRMTLERRFIDDPRQGMFARDIAKSLLRVASPQDAPSELGDLINEIEFDWAGVSVPIISAVGRPRPTLPQPPTRGYLVYLGQSPGHEVTWISGSVRLENADGPSGQRLDITVA
jgi:hypothetical protein